LCAGVLLASAFVAGAAESAPDMLSRVRNVDDPELGELIRAAMESYHSRYDRGNEEEMWAITRAVSESHAKIKLLDRQIEQLETRLKQIQGPEELRQEMVLAAAELESKRAIELAGLREVMGITPRYAFETRKVDDLTTWVHLVVLDQGVYVLDTLRGFSEYWANCRWGSVGVLSVQETLSYIREQLTDRRRRPLRFDLHYSPSMRGVAEDLRRKIMALAMETNSQMEVELHIEAITWTGSGEAPFFVRDGQIRTLYPVPVRRPDGFEKKTLVTGRVAPDDLAQHILWRLTKPGNVPLTFRIEYDRAGVSQAQRIASEIRRIAERLKVGGLVDVNAVLVDPIPEAVFRGRWRAVTPGEIQELEIRPESKTELLMRKWSEREAPMAKVAAPWTLATRHIFIETAMLEMYRGEINGEGRLVLDRGQIWPQGSWHDEGGGPMVFEKTD
jgi:hypothetical protein